DGAAGSVTPPESPLRASQHLDALKVECRRRQGKGLTEVDAILVCGDRGFPTEARHIQADAAQGYLAEAVGRSKDQSGRADRDVPEIVDLIPGDGLGAKCGDRNGGILQRCRPLLRRDDDFLYTAFFVRDVRIGRNDRLLRSGAGSLKRAQCGYGPKQGAPNRHNPSSTLISTHDSSSAA